MGSTVPHNHTIHIRKKNKPSHTSYLALLPKIRLRLKNKKAKTKNKKAKANIKTGWGPSLDAHVLEVLVREGEHGIVVHCLALKHLNVLLQPQTL